MESIGESFKTMFARYSNIKLGKMFEDDATNINDVEKALSLVNVKIRDSATSFRPMGDVFDEVASKWATYNELEQSAIANALAGVRQRENFLTLMSNYNVVLEQQTMQTTAAGQATERYQIYLESIEAAANKSKASWEAVWQTTINNDVIKFFYNLSAGIGDTINEMGGLIPLVMQLAGAFIALNFKNISTGLSSAISSLKLFFTTLKIGAIESGAQLAVATAGISLIIAGLIWAIGSLTGAFDSLEDRAQKTADKLEQINTKMSDLRDTKNNISELWKELETLKEKTSLAADEQERLTEIQNKIKGILPEVNGYYDDQGNYIIDLNTPLAEYVSLLNQQYDAEVRLQSLQSQKLLKEDIKLYQDAVDELQGLQNVRELIMSYRAGTYTPTSEGEATMLAGFDLGELDLQIAEQQVKVTTFMSEMRVSFLNLNKEIQDEIIKSPEIIGTGFGEILAGWYEGAIKASEELSSRAGADIAKAEASIANEVEKLGEIADHTAEELKKITDVADSVENSTVSSFKSMQSALEEYDQQGSISLSTAGALIDAGYAQALSIDQATGAISINIPMLQQLAIEQLNSAIKAKEHALSQLSLAEAAGIAGQSLVQEINVLNAQKKALSGNIVDTAGLIKAISSFTGATRAATGATKDLNAAKKQAYQDEIKAINKQKKALDAQKKALEDQKKAYKEIIEAKKESLKLAKDEADFNKTLEEKNRELVDIENELFAIQFDNSQEAMANRLQLEEEKAKKMEEIAELQADRTYEIQVDALDREYATFETMINLQIDGINSLIESFDAMIETINDMIEALGRLNAAQSGGSTSTAPRDSRVVTTPENVARRVSDIARAEAEAEAARQAAAAEARARALADISRAEQFASGGSFETQGTSLIKVHPDEVGLVLNGAQQRAVAPMASFFNSILKNNGSPKYTPSGLVRDGVTMGDVIIQVSGNLDKSIIPDIKSAVFEVLNQTNIMRGKRANAFTNSI